MSNPNGRRGAQWETDVVAFLKANGFPAAERRVREGAKDRGDIAGIPGVVIECKNEARINLPGYLREAEAERVNADAAIAPVFVKRRGKGVKDGYMVMDIETGVWMLRHMQGGQP